MKQIEFHWRRSPVKRSVELTSGSTVVGSPVREAGCCVWHQVIHCPFRSQLDAASIPRKVGMVMMSETIQVGSQTFVAITERDELQRKLDLLLAAATVTSIEAINGYENNNQISLPENIRLHRCRVCYESAIRLRNVIEEIQKP